MCFFGKRAAQSFVGGARVYIRCFESGIHRSARNDVLVSIIISRATSPVQISRTLPSQFQTLIPKINRLNNAGLPSICMSVVLGRRGTRFIRNLQNGPTQEVSTAHIAF